MSDRAEIEAHFLKAVATLLHAYNKAAAAFEKHGFISARPFNTKQPGGHKKQSSPFPKPLAVAKAVRHYQSRSPLLKPLSAVKAARRYQGRPPLLKPLAIVKNKPPAIVKAARCC
jgi:hypothetical protein